MPSLHDVRQEPSACMLRLRDLGCRPAGCRSQVGRYRSMLDRWRATVLDAEPGFAGGRTMPGQRAPAPMTVATFLEWASRRPEDERRDLVEGEPVSSRGSTPEHAMAAETVT